MEDYKTTFKISKIRKINHKLYELHFEGTHKVLKIEHTYLSQNYHFYIHGHHYNFENVDDFSKMIGIDYHIDEDQLQ